MKLTVNGERHEHNGEATLISLLRALRADGDRVATMVNDEIVAKEQRDNVVLKDGDRIEVLVFAGGG